MIGLYPCSVRYCEGVTALSGAPCNRCREEIDATDFDADVARRALLAHHRARRRRGINRLIRYALTRRVWLRNLRSGLVAVSSLATFGACGIGDSDFWAILGYLYWLAYGWVAVWALGVPEGRMRSEAKRLVRARAMGRRGGVSQ